MNIHLALILAAFLLFSLGVCVGMILNAPLAYEDPERGFVFGEPPFDEVRASFEKDCG